MPKLRSKREETSSDHYVNIHMVYGLHPITRIHRKLTFKSSLKAIGICAIAGGCLKKNNLVVPSYLSCCKSYTRYRNFVRKSWVAQGHGKLRMIVPEKSYKVRKSLFLPLDISCSRCKHRSCLSVSLSTKTFEASCRSMVMSLWNSESHFSRRKKPTR